MADECATAVLAAQPVIASTNIVESRTQHRAAAKEPRNVIGLCPFAGKASGGSSACAHVHLASAFILVNESSMPPTSAAALTSSLTS